MSEPTQVQKSLFYSIVDGVFFTVMVGCGERFFIPFILLLGASYLETSLLVSLPLLFGSLSQLFSSELIEQTNSRKKVVIRGVLLQALLFLPMIFLYFFIPASQTTFFIIIAILYMVSGNIVAPAWNSWMGDLVDTQSRGIYFGKRNKIMEISTLITFALAGYCLHIMKENHIEAYGFVILFAIALIARFLSLHFLNKQYEPFFKIKDESKFTFLQFIKKMKTTNFGNFVLFSALMNFSFFVSAPFFTPYMLKSLHFNYFQYMFAIAAGMASRIIFMPIWGEYADRYGTRKVLILSASFLPLTVLLWLVSPNFYFIVFIHLVAGFVWSGFELASFNFILDTTSSEKRARCVAYYNVVNGIFILFGSLLGSELTKIQILSAPVVYSAFLGSFVLRALVAGLFLPHLREIRKTEPIGYQKLFFLILLKPLHPFKPR